MGEHHGLHRVPPGGAKRRGDGAEVRVTGCDYMNSGGAPGGTGAGSVGGRRPAGEGGPCDGAGAGDGEGAGGVTGEGVLGRARVGVRRGAVRRAAGRGVGFGRERTPRCRRALWPRRLGTAGEARDVERLSGRGRDGGRAADFTGARRPLVWLGESEPEHRRRDCCDGQHRRGSRAGDRPPDARDGARGRAGCKVGRDQAPGPRSASQQGPPPPARSGRHPAGHRCAGSASQAPSDVRNTLCRSCDSAIGTDALGGSGIALLVKRSE